jgi:membrane-associated phospholipid phosphatase
MLQKISLLLFISCMSFTAAFSQVPKVPADTLIKKLDSLSQKTDSAGFQKNNINPAAYNDITKLTGREYFILLGSNLKQGFTKPFHMTRRDWGILGKFAVVAVGVGLADESIQREALKLRNKSSFVKNTGRYISQAGGTNEVFTLAAFGAYGLIVKSEKVKTTTLLATQAYITGAAIEAVLKTLSGRTRPNFYPVGKNPEPTFTGPFGNTSRDAEGKRSNSSFPSGHTTVAFAAATVFGKEYANKPIIPIVAYTGATLIGLSRITENKHWATDILCGAGLGYLVGRQVVNNYHRFAKIKNAEVAKKRGKIAFDLRYDFGKMMPGIVYTFK